MADRVTAACLVATLAFWAYTQTLLPGVDMGDTGGFQAAVLSPEVSARQAYPLYYRLARPFVATVSPSNPARGLNLFSAALGAVAVGLLVVVGASITGSIVSGVASGALLAFSYTFWSQAIIAEVYTLHLALVLACCVALLSYARQPTRLRLAVFFGIYALAFGNHLSMTLLLVPFAAFLVQVTPLLRSLFRPQIVAMALALAAAGALQYWPNFTSIWHLPDGPATWPDRFAAFWFDTTKSDWRDSMVLGIGPSQVGGRIGMWWFDARQQFGVPGLLLAVVGVARLWTISRPWTTLIVLGYAINTAFAFTYNVGDTHVFYLPSHLFTALAAGVAVSRTRTIDGRATNIATIRNASYVGAFVVLLYAGWRGWDTWPVVDRHDDRRAEALVTRFTLGINQRNAVLVTNLNWQIENALLYYTRFERRDIAWVRLPDVLPHFPFLVKDNEAISRDVVMDTAAARDVTAAYGGLFAIQTDQALPSPDPVDIVATLPRGTPYVLSVLTPPREEHLDPLQLAAMLATLSGNHAPALTGAAFQVVAGITGETPALIHSADRPFRADVRLLDDPFTIRMESWLPTDTFRRAGFGHVLRGRQRVQILERGVNLVWFDRSANPLSLYAASLYNPTPRYRISSAVPAFALFPSAPQNLRTSFDLRHDFTQGTATN